jgi:hypothetical protein
MEMSLHGNGRRNKNTPIWSGSMMMLGILSWSRTAGSWSMDLWLDYFHDLPQNETMHDRQDEFPPM